MRGGPVLLGEREGLRTYRGRLGPVGLGVVKEIFAPLRSTLAFARIRIARFAPIAGVAVIAVIAIIVRVARAFARLRSCVLASPRSRSARV